jgi:hypothetical protein
VSVSTHAVHRFIVRHSAMGRKDMDFLRAKRFIGELFNDAVQFEPTGKYRERQKKYGNSSLYFRNNEFVFVVENAKIVTIEIAAKGMRHLNNKE